MRTYYESHQWESTSAPFLVNTDVCVSASRNAVYPHWHENLEILLLNRGTGNFYVQNELREVHTNDVVIVNSNDVHFTFSEDPDCRISYLLISQVFCKDFDLYLEQLHFAPIVQDSFVTEMFHKLSDEVTAQRPLYQSAVRAQLITLLVHLVRNHTLSAPDPQRDSRQRELVQSAIQYIATHLSEPLSIDSIADAMGFSKFYFCRVFKEETGQTVMEHLNRVRCDHAKLLLATGKHTITECAALCGFTNPAYFSTQYKKYAGQTPSEHRKR